MTISAFEKENLEIKEDANVAQFVSAKESLLDLILSRVRLRARRRAQWLAYLNANNDHIGLEAGAALLAALDDRDSVENEQQWVETTQHLADLNQQIDQLEHVFNNGPSQRLQELGQLFFLTQHELEVLQTCIAISIDPTLGTAYAHLQNNSNRTFATEPLATRLFGRKNYLTIDEASPLIVWGLITTRLAMPGEPTPLVADSVIIDWLQGEIKIDPLLLHRSYVASMKTPMESWAITNAIQWIKQSLEKKTAIRIQVSGRLGSGRRSFSAWVAENFGMQTLCIDTTDVPDEEWFGLYVKAQRFSILAGMAITWYGKNITKRWPESILPGPLQFVITQEHTTLIPSKNTVDHFLEIPELTVKERHQVWNNSFPPFAKWEEEKQSNLSSRYQFNIGEIKNIAYKNETDAEKIFKHARNETKHQLDQFGRQLDCPFVWKDLVVNERLRRGLEEFLFEARDRVGFWELSSAKRLFPRGKGLTALFSGPPGTGKTMAAQVMAKELGIDIVRVDLASVVSKYIGDTAKHVSLIFNGAKRMNAVLFFDEADALFSKRTEVKDYHDKHANADTGYLLQLLEEHDGIVILSSNRKQNIDRAFTRRLRYVFEFPRPEATERRIIFHQLVNELFAGKVNQPLISSIELISNNVDLSGAQIKNILLTSIFISRRNNENLSMKHLLAGVESELNKEAKALSIHNREKLFHHV